ncbi:hypothetical protein [Planotetraspora sp. GP83]|uniref:hypothetical protein n=1 Tax=Planotetraspora sp. GP83 TaxID=3156264 RepID=UPI0035154B58
MVRRLPLDARLPRPDVPAKATQHLDRHRQRHNDQLELDLKTIAERVGLPHRAHLDVEPAARLGIPACPARSTSWSPTSNISGCG